MGKRMRRSVAACVSLVAVSLVLAGASGAADSARWVCDDGGGRRLCLRLSRGRSSRGRCLPGVTSATFDRVRCVRAVTANGLWRSSRRKGAQVRWRLGRQRRPVLYVEVGGTATTTWRLRAGGLCWRLQRTVAACSIFGGGGGGASDVQDGVRVAREPRARCGWRAAAAAREPSASPALTTEVRAATSGRRWWQPGLRSAVARAGVQAWSSTGRVTAAQSQAGSAGTLAAGGRRWRQHGRWRWRRRSTEVAAAATALTFPFRRSACGGARRRRWRLDLRRQAAPASRTVCARATAW